MTNPTHLDFPTIAAALGMRGTCTIHLVNPVEENVERPDAGAIHVRSAAGRPLKRIQIGRDPPMRQVSRTNVVRRQMRNL